MRVYVFVCEKRQSLSSAIGRSCCLCRIWRQRQPLFHKLQQLTSLPGLPLGPEDQTPPPLRGEPGPPLPGAAGPSPGSWLSGSWHVGVLLVWWGCPEGVWHHSHNPQNEACRGTSQQPLLTTAPALTDPRHKTTLTQILRKVLPPKSSLRVPEAASVGAGLLYHALPLYLFIFSCFTS